MAAANLQPQPRGTYMIEGQRRGGRLLVFEGYRYSRGNNSVLRIYWRCSTRNCGQTLVINNFNREAPNPNIQVFGANQANIHVHLPDDNTIARRNLVDAVLDLVLYDPSRTTRTVYNAVVARRDFDPADIPAFETSRGLTLLFLVSTFTLLYPRITNLGLCLQTKGQRKVKSTTWNYCQTINRMVMWRQGGKKRWRKPARKTVRLLIG